MENEFSAVFAHASHQRKEIPESLFWPVEKTAAAIVDEALPSTKRSHVLRQPQTRNRFEQVDRLIRNSFTFPAPSSRNSLITISDQ